MPSRFKSRQQALQMLYLWDVRRQPIHDVIVDYYGSLAHDEEDETEARDGFAEDLAIGAVSEVEAIDAIIGKHSEHWRLDRMPVVDRNILRLGVFEMSKRATPSAVVIDQALELARRFAGDESISFLNGVLDAINRAIRPEVPPSAD